MIILIGPQIDRPSAGGGWAGPDPPKSHHVYRLLLLQCWGLCRIPRTTEDR